MSKDQRSTRRKGHYKTGEPSVTTILKVLNKPALNIWLCKNYFRAAREGCQTLSEARQQVNKISKKARDIGIDVHTFVEMKTTGIKPELDPKYTNYYKAFNDWLIDYNPEFLESEITVASKAYFYKGTIDLIAKIDSKICLVDLKTGKAIYETVELQASAYKVAFEEQEKKGIDELWCLLLEKGRDGLPTGKYKFKKLRFKPEVFNSLLTVYNWVNEK